MAGLDLTRLDPKHMADWQIAEAAADHMKTVYQLGDELGLEREEVLPYGHYVAKLDFGRILNRLADAPGGRQDRHHDRSVDGP